MAVRSASHYDGIAMNYPDIPDIPSRQAVYIELVIAFLLAAALVTVAYLRSGSSAISYIPELIYLFIPVTVTFKILTHLAQQERLVREPDANMRLLFRLAVMTPIYGYIPVLVFAN